MAEKFQIARTEKKVYLKKDLSKRNRTKKEHKVEKYD